MIYVLDCNALQHLQKRAKSIRSKNRCVVPDAIKEEFLENEGNRVWFIAQEFENPDLDFGVYLTEYARILNQYGDVSFYSLKGFGDVGILAVLNLILGRQDAVAAATLSPELFPGEEIVLVSNDDKLRRFASDNLSDRLRIQTPEEFESSI